MQITNHFYSIVECRDQRCLDMTHALVFSCAWLCNFKHKPEVSLGLTAITKLQDHGQSLSRARPKKRIQIRSREENSCGLRDRERLQLQFYFL